MLATTCLHDYFRTGWIWGYFISGGSAVGKLSFKLGSIWCEQSATLMRCISKEKKKPQRLIRNLRLDFQKPLKTRKPSQGLVQLCPFTKRTHSYWTYTNTYTVMKNKNI